MAAAEEIWLRVLQVHTRYRQPGGEDTVVGTERAMLSAGGHEVEVHELQNPDNPRDALVALARSPWNRGAAEAVAAHARAFSADVVHVHNTWFALSPGVFAALSAANFPTVVTMHNYRLTCVAATHYRDQRLCEDCVGHLPWRGVIRRCYRNSSSQSSAVAVTIAAHRVRRTWHRDVDVVVALTPFAVRLLVAGGVPEDRIVIKPNTVADPGDRRQPPSASRAILFVGRMTEEKGVLDLISAWKIADLPTEFRLAMVGDGPLRSLIEADAPPGIDLFGWERSNSVARRMAEARLLVFPSRWYEGLPMVIVEAMSWGLGVAVPEHGALPQIAGSGGTSFNGADPGALAAALRTVTSDEAVDRLGAGARAEFMARFTSDLGLEQLEALYQRAITTRRGRSA